MDDLPPDLSRLGGDLTDAVDRSLRRRRWRRRLVNRAATVGTSGALIFVVMTPAVLEPANRGALPASVRIEATQGALQGPYDAETLARLCEPSYGNAAPMCGYAQQTVASWESPAAYGRTPARALEEPAAQRSAR